MITVVLDKPIETDGMSTPDTGDLRDQVREVIAGRVEAMGGAVG